MLSVIHNPAIPSETHDRAAKRHGTPQDREAPHDPGLAIARRYATAERAILAGMEVYAEGEPSDELFIVTEGWVFQHQILEDGRRQILDFALPGTLLGFQPTPGAEMTHTAEALTDARVAVIPRERLGDMFAQQPEFALRVVSAAAGALDTAYESLTDVGRRTAREAIAHLLLRMFGRICAHAPRVAGTAIGFPLTQEHIGDALGLTAVHVCRTLRGLRQEGVVQLCNGTLTVIDAEALADVAGSRVEIVGRQGSARAMPRHDGSRRRMAG